MRTSLNKIKAIEDYLSGAMPAGDALLFEANMLIDSELIGDVQSQENTYDVIKQYGRQEIKAEIIAARKIFVEAPKYRSFMQRITKLFTMA